MMQPHKPIVLLGDSITQAWPMADPSFFEAGHFISKGIGGQTTTQLRERFARDVIAHAPQVVVILGGTNDIAGNGGPMTPAQTMDNLVAMAEMAKANHIAVVLCSVLPTLDYPWNPGKEPAEKIAALNQKIADYAAQNQIAYADYYSVTVDANKALRKEF